MYRHHTFIDLEQETVRSYFKKIKKPAGFLLKLCIFAGEIYIVQRWIISDWLPH
jgi:hypothetical protein